MAQIQFLNPTMRGVANANAAAETSNFTSTAYSDPLNASVMGGLNAESIQLCFTVAVGASTAAVSASGSQVTDSGGDLLFTNSSANVFKWGRIVQFTTSTTLPTGISADTDYYVVPITNATYKVATSLANAIAGTYVAYTNTGTGNQTATPVALAGATMLIQGSNDNGTTWWTVPNTSTSISASGSTVVEVDYVRFLAYRAALSLTTGQLSFSAVQFSYRGGA